MGGADGAAHPTTALVVSNRAGISRLVPALGPALSRPGHGRADRRGGEGVFDWIGGGSQRIGWHAECGVQRVALSVSGGVWAEAIRLVRNRAGEGEKASTELIFRMLPPP